MDNRQNQTDKGIDKPGISAILSGPAAPGSKRSGKGLAAMVNDTSQESLASVGFPLETWAKILLLGGVFILLTYWQYRPILLNCLSDTNWSHGFVIPLFSLFLLYQRRGEIMTTPRKASYVGLALMIFGIGSMLYFKYPLKFSYGSQLSMLLVLLGLVWYMAGTKVMLLAWLPILYISFAIPFSDMIYNRISVPLQQLAAAVSGDIMTLLGVQEMEVSNSNMTFLTKSGQIAELTVAEACSGVRSLMAFAALGVAMAYVALHPFWHRLVMV
ncbi:MAG TPA: exosortase/archaeosortase family protein, partial [Phycisphaerae bacterium]|nr:exosortase/archaeosortase family protein [Phycisphaerae bacterium]